MNFPSHLAFGTFPALAYQWFMLFIPLLWPSETGFSYPVRRSETAVQAVSVAGTLLTQVLLSI